MTVVDFKQTESAFLDALELAGVAIKNIDGMEQSEMEPLAELAEELSIETQKLTEALMSRI